MVHPFSRVVSASYLVTTALHFFFQHTLRASCLPPLSRRQGHSPEPDAASHITSSVCFWLRWTARGPTLGGDIKLTLRPGQDPTTGRSGGKPS